MNRSITRKVPVKRRRSTPRRSSRVLDPQYLAFMRTLPCWVCYRHVYAVFAKDFLQLADTPCSLYGRQKSDTEPAHVGLSTSRRGLSQKYPDIESIPLCKEHHTAGPESIHELNPEPFFAQHGADRDETVRAFQALYREHCK